MRQPSGALEGCTAYHVETDEDGSQRRKAALSRRLVTPESDEGGSEMQAETEGQRKVVYGIRQLPDFVEND